MRNERLRFTGYKTERSARKVIREKESIDSTGSFQEMLANWPGLTDHMKVAAVTSKADMLVSASPTRAHIADLLRNATRWRGLELI